uniref:Myblike DNAbinding protein putative n=1 Tax=Albugo laibachii Nc14 TaxID=890382 RepID=F0WSG7_9STRA|nr:myblike DNAbinding protein putative [Albugo laibachii Nc14]|eukprot:CCA24289.1 myblike DNAbinding protein putative [Albugo laibachii Nc14]
MSVSTPLKESSALLDSDSAHKPNFGIGHWSRIEHERFLEALRIYPKGSWKTIAEYVGTRTIRQTMTHAQKLRQKTRRCLRALEVEKHMTYRHPMMYDPREYALREQLRLLSRNVTLKSNSGMHSSHSFLTTNLHHSRPSFSSYQDSPHACLTPMAMMEPITPLEQANSIECPGKIGGETLQDVKDVYHKFNSLEPIMSVFDGLSGPSLEECASALLEIFSFQL